MGPSGTIVIMMFMLILTYERLFFVMFCENHYFNNDVYGDKFLLRCLCLCSFSAIIMMFRIY